LLRIIVFCLSFLLITPFHIPKAWAEISCFGGDDLRRHVVEEPVYPAVAFKWEQNTGVSNSQPLIIENGTPDGLPRIYMQGGHYLWSFNTSGKPLWPSPPRINDENTTSSYTTYHSLDGKLYSGTTGGEIVVHDQNGRQIPGAKVKIGSRVVSAPLVKIWQGHTILVAGSDNGSVYVIADLTGKNIAVTHIPIGGALTSSPAPIGNDGFVIGSDGQTGKVAGIYFADLFQIEKGVIKIKANPRARWLKDNIPTGIPASFAVDGDYLFFSHKKGGLYKINKYNGEIAKGWPNTTAAYSGSTFTNYSPAVDDNYVYFPIKSRHGGNGAVMALNKSTGAKVAQITLHDKVTTAPLILKQAGVLLVGQGAGWIGVYKIGTWKTIDTVKIVDPPDAPKDRKVPNGITAELSLSDNLLLIGGNYKNGDTAVGGVLTAFTVSREPVDLQALSLDPGVPAGQKARPGATYIATATYKYREKQYPNDPASILSPLTAINVRAFRDNSAAPLKNDPDNPLEAAKTTIDLMPGNTVTLKFKWTAPNAAQTTVKARINLDPTMHGESYLENNVRSVVVPVDIPEQDLDLTVTRVDNINPVFTGNNYVADVFYQNDSSVPTETLLRFYVNDRKISEKTVFIGAGSRDSTQFNWPAPDSTGTVTLKATVNPGHILKETDYNNNTASRHVEVQNPGTTLCNEPQKTWTETYSLLVAHIYNKKGEHIGDTGATRAVTYTESLNMTAAPLDDKGNAITGIKAGYGFYLSVNTTYATDYETKVPTGLHGTARAKGGAFPGAQEVYAIFPDGSKVFMEPTGSTDNHTNTWRLPEQYRTAIGANTRKHYTGENTPDGDYVITVVATDAGRNGLCITKKIILKVRGSMYDDTDTHLTG